MKLSFSAIARSRATFSLMLAASLGCAAPSMAEVPVIVSGSPAAGDQATIALDTAVPAALSYARLPTGANTATAYFNWHLFCAETSGSGSAVQLLPRYQLPPTTGADIWKFPEIYAYDLELKASGAQSAGAPALTINQSGPSPRSRCLSALPGSSLEPWTVNRGLFASGFGDYVGASNAALGTPPPATAPAGPHQNVKVTAKQYDTLVAGRSVAVVRVETQFDSSTPSTVNWSIIDAHNGSALGSDARWCLLRPDWVDGAVPPAALCNDASVLFPGVTESTGAFMRQGMGFIPGSYPGPFYVLVSRSVVGTSTAGTPKQGFAAIHVANGLSGASEEMQDWYLNDSVWYNF